MLAHFVVQRLEVRLVLLQLALAGRRADAQACGQGIEAARVGDLTLQLAVDMFQQSLFHP
ncbi:MAG: hypothetical protein GAK45_01257 [Pseudomonas citronellolis]|nr:MAG: hypothetical protein GAK45_01257 [Pseudomonas citronellolis]